MINRMKMHRFLSVWQTAINIPSRPIFLLSVLCTSKGSREKAFFLRPGQPKEGGLREGLLTCTKSDEFSRKNTTAPPSFSENYVANFLWWIWLHIYARRYDGQIVWNTCTLFPEIGTILRGGGWGSPALWNLSENSSDLVAWPVP